MNLLHKVRIVTGLPLRRTANCRIAWAFMLPAIGLDAKFRRQCEFDHTDCSRCSLSEECVGKRAIWAVNGPWAPVVVIYLTSISVSALINVRHGRYPTAPRPCDGNLELARRPDPRHVSRADSPPPRAAVAIGGEADRVRREPPKVSFVSAPENSRQPIQGHRPCRGRRVHRRHRGISGGGHLAARIIAILGPQRAYRSRRRRSRRWLDRSGGPGSPRRR
jgi:hypothetical protein